MLSGVVWAGIKDLQCQNDHIPSFGNMVPVDLGGILIAPVMATWRRYEDYMRFATARTLCPNVHSRPPGGYFTVDEGGDDVIEVVDSTRRNKRKRVCIGIPR